MDCNQECFGNAEIDDCGVCNGNNQNCLETIFEYTPHNLYALIQDSSILISWEFSINLQNSFIENFNIYHEQNGLNLIGSTQELQFETSDFTSGYFCISAVDQFNNESEVICAEASPYSSFSYNLHAGANLLSFPYIPEDNSLDNIFYSIKNQIDGIIGEGVAAQYEGSIDSFIGSMDQIYHKNGYWVKIKHNLAEESINLNISGFPYQEDTMEYELHEGYNLISYLGPDNLNIEEAIPEELLNSIVSIIGEGTASTQIQNQWIGNLNYLKYGSGYWVKSNSNNILFYWNNP